MMKTLNRFKPLPLAITCIAAMVPAHAASVVTDARANGSVYSHNSISGEVIVEGSAGGTSGVGGSVSASFADGVIDFGPPGTSHASATANLSTGSLHAVATSTAYYGDARAYAAWADTVTFHIAGGTAASLTPIIVELVLAGAISEERSAGYLYNLKMFTAGSSGGHVGWTTQFYDSPTDARNYVGWAVAGGAGEPNGWQSWELLAGTATHKHFRGVLLVPGAQKEYLIETTLSMHCASGVACDFGHSARLRFDLPQGVSFTSGSGVLLTAVPEPQTWALVLAGLGVMGFVVRRRSA